MLKLVAARRSAPTLTTQTAIFIGHGELEKVKERFWGIRNWVATLTAPVAGGVGFWNQ